MVNLEQLIDDAKCYQTIRDLHWPEASSSTKCCSIQFINPGNQAAYSYRTKYQSQTSGNQFYDVSGAIFESHHQPLRTWFVCLYLMDLYLSNEQIAAELDLLMSEVLMTTELHGTDRQRRGAGVAFMRSNLKTLEGFWSLLHSWVRPHCSPSRQSIGPPALGYLSSSLKLFKSLVIYIHAFLVYEISMVVNLFLIRYSLSVFLSYPGDPT